MLNATGASLPPVVAGKLPLVVLKAVEPAGALPMAMPGFMVAVAVDIVLFALI